MTRFNPPHGVGRTVSFADEPRVRAMAYRPRRREPMIEVERCDLKAALGLVNEERKQSNRQVTLLSVESWTDACRELGADLPWYLRRANLLVVGIDLAKTVGCTIGIGEVRIKIHGESKPCALMDYQYKGLRSALKPASRGGVFGEVLASGVLRTGMQVAVESH